MIKHLEKRKKNEQLDFPIVSCIFVFLGLGFPQFRHIGWSGSFLQNQKTAFHEIRELSDIFGGVRKVKNG